MSEPPSHPETLDRGRYRIERMLGIGGTASVLLAFDTRIGVYRAIKLLMPKFAASPANRTRFQNEARAQAGLKHPNVLMVHDTVADEQGVYMVMELAESDSLGQRVLRQGTLSAREVADVGIAIGGALSVAHQAGVVHRDVKPGNILVDKHGVLKLADFGIARVEHEGQQQLTQDGSIMGTWAYMPPEQRADSHDVDHRADIYAFGVTLYALLTGQHYSNLHNKEGHDQAFSQVPPALAQVLKRATRLFPEDRYQSVAEMVQALKEIADTLGEVAANPDITDPQGYAPVLAPTDASPDAGPPRPDHRQMTAVPTTGDASPEASLPPRAAPVSAAVADPDSATDVHLITRPPAHLGQARPVGGTAPPPTSLPPPARPGATLLKVGAAAAILLLVGGLSAAAALVLYEALQGPAAPQPPTVDLQPDPPVDGPPPPTDPVEPPAPSPEDPPANEDPAGPAGDPDPATPAAPEANAGGSTGTGGTPQKPTRRVITVLPEEDGDATSTSADPAPQDTPATGAVVVKTVPSGALVKERGRTLSGTGGGTYTLPVGQHTLELVSPAGERTRMAVAIQEGRTVEICYSFDTNSACGAVP